MSYYPETDGYSRNKVVEIDLSKYADNRNKKT